MADIIFTEDGILDGSTTKIDPTVAELQGFDVVITTYDIIENERRAMDSISKEQNQRPEANIAKDVPKHSKCSLFAVDWWFVILDEAHNISDPNTYISQAVCDLEGKFRVLISGTPIHDEYRDIQGVLRFKRIEPWNDLGLFKNVNSCTARFDPVLIDKLTVFWNIEI